MIDIPGWSAVIASMEPDEKKNFMTWWKGLPPFNHAFDMQAIVALSFIAGRKSQTNE